MLLSFFLAEEPRAAESGPQIEIPIDAGGVSAPTDSAIQIKNAELLLKRGKTDAAIYLLQQAEKADPQNYTILFKLGEMAISAKNWAYAIHVLRKASFLRPHDAEVRLVLIDIYKAYQMPIQEIIVCKEILVIDPVNVRAATRLAELYQKQGMHDEEIEIRQKILTIAPKDYQNLKRLAEISLESDSAFEAAKIYEIIQQHYPEKTEDLRRLASIYLNIDESFRAIQVLKQIVGHDSKDGWLKSQAEKTQKLKLKRFDQVLFHSDFGEQSSNEMKSFSSLSAAEYFHPRIFSQFDLGLKANYSRTRYNGKGLLDGTMDLDSTSLHLTADRKWQGETYQLSLALGFLNDRVSGRLFPKNPQGATDIEQFPFLSDPSFSSYGGTMTIGELFFAVRPGLHADYQISYERGQLSDFDARLRMFYYDRASAEYMYETASNHSLRLQADKTLVSDGNSRYHSLAAIHYLLWASNEMRDYLGRRRGFLRQYKVHFIKAAYQLDYFNDDDKSVYYQTYDEEIRHTGLLTGQIRLLPLSLDEHLFLKLNVAYAKGSTLEFRRTGSLDIFYFNDSTENEIGLNFGIEEESVNDLGQQNLRLSGKTYDHRLSFRVKWRF